MISPVPTALNSNHFSFPVPIRAIREIRGQFLPFPSFCLDGNGAVLLIRGSLLNLLNCMLLPEMASHAFPENTNLRRP